MTKAIMALAAVSLLGLAACTGPSAQSTRDGDSTIDLSGNLSDNYVGNNDRRASLVAAGVTTLSGPRIARYMSRNEADLRAAISGSGLSITGNGDKIVVTMPASVSFASGDDQLVSSFVPTLRKVAQSMLRYNNTLINVSGHTDSLGDNNSNQALSLRRARTVAWFLSSRGVNPERFYTVGHGEHKPVASNETEGGREQNRRVEIEIIPLTSS